MSGIKNIDSMSEFQEVDGLGKMLTLFLGDAAGKGIAHQFINTGDEVLEILDAGLKVKDDVAYYPDEDIIYIRGQKKVFKQAQALEGWTSEPNSP